MFSITKQTDYALVTIYQLRDRDEYVPLSELVEKTNMPKRFLARIAAELVKYNILESKEGKTGGYKLAQDPAKISLYEVLKIFEKDLDLISCNDGDNECVCSEACHHKDFLGNKLTTILKQHLKNVSVADTFK